MQKLSKRAILDKTHYGLNIYSHILRIYYLNETVLALSGRTCLPTKNPFNADKSTLNIYIDKSNPDNVFSDETACHTDSENAIPRGNAIDFAQLHYKQQGEELLQTINKDLNLRIGEKFDFYARNRNKVAPRDTTNEEVLFSFFKAPISNIKPRKTVNLLQIHKAIKGEFYKDRTQKLRAITDVARARSFKARNFDYCTFSGIFSARNEKSIIKHSGLLCIDFDHLQTVDLLRNQLLQDEYFDTQLLFVSPSGNGLKWIIEIDINKTSHSGYFNAVANYLRATYNVEVDKSGKDTSRACFLSHDPEAFINPSIK